MSACKGVCVPVCVSAYLSVYFTVILTSVFFRNLFLTLYHTLSLSHRLLVNTSGSCSLKVKRTRRGHGEARNRKGVSTLQQCNNSSKCRDTKITNPNSTQPVVITLRLPLNNKRKLDVNPDLTLILPLIFPCHLSL